MSKMLCTYRLVFYRLNQLKLLLFNPVNSSFKLCILLHIFLSNYSLNKLLLGLNQLIELFKAIFGCVSLKCNWHPWKLWSTLHYSPFFWSIKILAIFDIVLFLVNKSKGRLRLRLLIVIIDNLRLCFLRFFFVQRNLHFSDLQIHSLNIYKQFSFISFSPFLDILCLHLALFIELGKLQKLIDLGFLIF